MDERKTIQQYINDVPLWLMILGVVFLAGTLGCVFMALHTGAGELPEPVPFDALTGEKDAYSYLDVIGVSDWIYSYDDATYYILEDTDHLLNVGRLTDRDFKALQHQNDYWNELTDQEIPVRLTGITLAITDTMRDNFMEVCDLTGEEFDDYFGRRSFYAGTSPRKEDVDMWSAFALMLGIFAASILIAGAVSRRRERRALRRLEEAGLLSRAAAELNSPLTESVQKDRLRLGSRFVFGRRAGLAAPWEDVLWCYERIVRSYGIVTGHMLILCTADGRAHAVSFGRKDEEDLHRVMEIIRERNPRVLLGFNRENRRAWKEQCR